MGGEGLKVSPEIIKEMAKRGDKLALKILERNCFERYMSFFEETDLKYTFLEDPDNIGSGYDRGNATLIQIIKEGKMRNNGGMDLMVAEVYDDPEYTTYNVCEQKDSWNSEYIKGYYREIAIMKG